MAPCPSATRFPSDDLTRSLTAKLHHQGAGEGRSSPVVPKPLRLHSEGHPLHLCRDMIGRQVGIDARHLQVTVAEQFL